MHAIVAIEMTSSPNLYPRQRAPRVKLAGSVLVLIELENRQQIRAKLNQLSINGGLLQLTEPLEEQAPVHLMFHLGSTTVRAQAETISPLRATQGCLQPFRFTDIREEDRRQLDTDLQSMFGIASATKPEPWPIPRNEGAQPQAPAPNSDSNEALATYAEASPPQVSGFDQQQEARQDESADVNCKTDASDSTACQVTLYFDNPQDALRFTVAMSAVLFIENQAREDVTRLLRELAKVGRVTTTGVLGPGQYAADGAETQPTVH